MQVIHGIVMPFSSYSHTTHNARRLPGLNGPTVLLQCLTLIAGELLRIAKSRLGLLYESACLIFSTIYCMQLHFVSPLGYGLDKLI